MSRTSLAILIAGSGLLVVSAAHAQSNDEPSTWEPSEGSHTLPRGSAAGKAGGLPTRPAESAEQPSQAPTPPIQSAEQRSQPAAPPIALPTRPTISPTPVNPWFVRPPFVLTAGAGSDWKLTIYGFAEADVMRDSTRSFNDGLNNNVIAHPLTQAGRNPRLQTTIRNSRIGFKAEAPAFYGIRSSGLLEFDLFGNQPSINSGGGSPMQASGPGATTEAAYFNNAAFRVRHAYVKLEMTSSTSWRARCTTSWGGRTTSSEPRAVSSDCPINCSIERCSFA